MPGKGYFTALAPNLGSKLRIAPEFLAPVPTFYFRRTPRRLESTRTSCPAGSSPIFACSILGVRSFMPLQLLKKRWTRRPVGHKYIQNEVESQGDRCMPGASSSREVLRHLNTLFHCGTAGQLSDAELLNRFVASRDEAAEAAFAALVERHGAMVLGVCRRVLGNRHAAEDAFQATFLVLARKASAIARREQLASWLYGVARHTALDARVRAIRQQAKEKRLGSMLPVERPDQTETSELRAILDEELARLPERYRAAIVLCELEGLTRRQAAGRLGVSEGTLSSRLARAKEQLRGRLIRRGLALSAAALASALSREAHAVIVAPALVDSTIRVATLVAAGSSLAGVVSTSVATLTEGVLKAMLFAKLKMIVLGVVTVALVTTGVGVVAQQPVPGPRPEAAGVKAQDRPGPRPDHDRLKAVEEKLDRLLEVLGGSSRFEARYPATAPPPPPGATFLPVPNPNFSVSGSYSLSPNPTPQPAANPSAPAIAATTGPGSSQPYVVNPAGGSFSAATPPYGQSTSLEGRVASLEQRLSQLEQRFGDMERRLNGLDSRPGQPPLPPGATSSPRRGRGGSPRPSQFPDGSVRPTTNATPPALPRGDLPSLPTMPPNPPSADNVPRGSAVPDGPPTAELPPVANDSNIPTAPASADLAPDSLPSPQPGPPPEE
jgi:RNA polymerase sigma factor (sigma-70 family)